MEILGTLKKCGDRFEFSFPEFDLVVRGDQAEWVLEAAAEVMATTEKLRLEGVVEELQTLVEFEEASQIEVDSAKYDIRSRFENLPQCLVVLGGHDYRWLSPAGRKSATALDRIQDMSLTRNDTFLENEDIASE